MACTVSGGKNAAKTNRDRYGEDFYKRIGKIGGSKMGTSGGFGCAEYDENGLNGRDRARIYGAKGGRKSRRRKAVEA